MMTRAAVDGIGYAAATMTTVSFLPQLIRVVRLRSAREISLLMFLVFSAGTFSWMVYGMLTHSMPGVVANVVTFGLSLSILVLKLKFDRKALRVDTPEGGAE